jgi:hypothetical protein
MLLSARPSSVACQRCIYTRSLSCRSLSRVCTTWDPCFCVANAFQIHHVPRIRLLDHAVYSSSFPVHRHSLSNVCGFLSLRAKLRKSCSVSLPTSKFYRGQWRRPHAPVFRCHFCSMWREDGFCMSGFGCRREFTVYVQAQTWFVRLEKGI